MLFFGVTPCVGVWIEIDTGRRRVYDLGVTPCVGVWIEIILYNVLHVDVPGHSLRGSVD